MRILWQDLRYGFKTLGRTPGFTAVVTVVLALGIGAATSVFSVVNGALLRALPYEDPDRLAMLFSTYSKWGLNRAATSGMNFLDWQAQNRSFEGMAVLRSEETTYRHDVGTDHIEGLCVSPNLFFLLGWEALVGRTFRAEETWPNHHYVVLGHDFWQRCLGGDEAVLGKAITLGRKEQAYTVVGIMPPGLRFLDDRANAFIDFWIPVDRDLPEIALGGRGCLRWNIVGRLKSGVSVEDAQAEIGGIAERIAQTEFGDTTHAPGVDVIPLHTYVVGDVRLLVLLAGGAAGFVLLIACTNVVTLLLVRGLARRREIATRAALGASRARLFCQAIIESVLLSLLGGVLGVLLAYSGVEVLRAIVPGDLARLEEIAIDPGTLMFAFGAILLSGVAVGLVPAWRTCRLKLNEVLKADSRGATLELARRRLAGVFVASEVSLSLVLLISSGLMINSLFRLLRLDPGYRTENILTLELENARGDNSRELLERTRSLPGVRSAALVHGLPLCGGIMLGSDIVPEGRPESEIGQHMVTARIVSPGYFHTMGIPFRVGQDFTEKDNTDSVPVTIINESLARRFWPDQDPVGKRFEFGWAGATVAIVGVVRDTKSVALDKAPVLEAFLPFQQKETSRFSLVVATESDPMSLAKVLRQDIRSVDVDVVIREVRTMATIVGTTLSARRFLTVVLSVFSIVAIILASFGLYGVVAHSVRQRTSEIGIRMALGATNGNILTSVLGEGFRIAVVGIVVGLAVALALTRVIASFLYDVSPTDPTIFILTALLLVGVVLLASYVPARRAARIDPMVALRYE